MACAATAVLLNQSLLCVVFVTYGLTKARNQSWGWCHNCVHIPRGRVGGRLVRMKVLELGEPGPPAMSRTRRCRDRWPIDLSRLSEKVGAMSISPAARRPIAAVVASFFLLTTLAGPSAVIAGTLPLCPAYDDIRTKYHEYSDWHRTLLDTIYLLPSGYAPLGMADTSKAGFSGGHLVRHRLIDDLKALGTAARAAGARLDIESAYRSYTSQIATFSYWVSAVGYATALRGRARRGHSEHQLGTAIDFKSYGGGTPWMIGGYDWGQTVQGRWLRRHAWRYGFVMSYPPNSFAQACYKYEPWHFRYFGRDIARRIHDSELVPRVWLWRHGSDQ
jgi:hypothetical protein